MARSKNSKAAPTRVPVDVGSTGTRPAPKSAVVLLIMSILAAVWAVAMMTVPGKIAYLYLFEYLKFYMGVVALVSLSVTIMVGLVATDRLVLSIRQRVLLQSAHRTTGVIAVGGLFIHVWTKFIDNQIGAIDIVIPFLVPGFNRFYIGLGTLSGVIMVLVMWTGLARSKFVGRGKPWMWRSLHAISYLMWPIALTHGLTAGRPAATWVIVSYVICMLAVLVGLAVRLSVSLNRRKDFSSAAGVGAGAPKPASKIVPTATPAPLRRPGRRGEPAVDLLAPAGSAAETWVPAAPPARPVSPAAARPVSPAPRPPAGPAPRPVQDDDYPAPRGRRPQPELEAPAPRPRRAVEDDDRYDTSTRAMSRQDIEDYRYDEEPAPRSRGVRPQEMYDAGPRRARRFDDDEPAPRDRRAFEDTSTRMRRDVEATGTRMRRDDVEATGTRMRRDDVEATGTRMRRDDVEATGTRMRRDDLEATGTRMRRYADDEPPPRARRREPDYDDRRDEGYDDVPRPRGARHEERYEETPRRADGRHGSRSQFVDLSDDQWGGEPGYDDSLTMVDTAPRRSRRAAPPEAEPRGHGGRRGAEEDEAYFSQLRGDRS